jgi:hypothetical protein
MLPRIKQGIMDSWVAGWSIFQSHFRLGTNVFESDWDLLIVLDACRVDALRAVAEKYRFISDVDSIWSVGSTSKEWIENTFVEEYKPEISETALITANTFSGIFRPESEGDDRFDYILSQDTKITNSRTLKGFVNDDVVTAADFYYFDDIGKKIVGKSKYGELHPKTVTERAISIGRDQNPDKLIVHYMQPHQPYLYPDELEEIHRHPFQYVNSENGRRRVWDAYIKNLEFVLEYAETLLSNVDAETAVITSDHGELFGKYLYSHPVGVLHPALRKVPWVITTASDTRSCEPDVEELDRASDDELKERLAALGYR